MSTSQPDQTGDSKPPVPLAPGSSPLKMPESAEESLVKEYMDLTAETELQARSVFMFVDPDGEKPDISRPDK